MMKNFTVFLSLIGIALLNIIAIDLPLKAQNKQKTECRNLDALAEEETSQTTRTIKLDKFGIKIEIPSNYKTMLRNDGSVSILHPYTFEVIRCKYAQGIYDFYIQLLDNPKNLSLEQLARSSKASGYGVINTHKYNKNGIKAVVVDFTGGSGSYAYALFNVPGIDKVVSMSASCDCDVDKAGIVFYLDKTEYINK